MLITKQSSEKTNYFAPYWRYDFWQSKHPSKELIQDLKALILKKEPEIIAQFPDVYSDGYTRLGKDSMTGKFTHYNLFDWKEEPAVAFTEYVKEQHRLFLLSLNLPIPKAVYGKCWANVLRVGQRIDAHWHSCNPNSYLSGHFAVACENTSTHYRNCFNENDIFSFKNEPGNLFLFPDYMVHWSDIHYGSKERITIAFDLYTYDDARGRELGYGFFNESPKVAFEYNEN